MTTRGTLRLWDIQGKRWRGPESGSGDKSGPCRGETWSRDVITQGVAGEKQGPSHIQRWERQRGPPMRKERGAS